VSSFDVHPAVLVTVAGFLRVRARCSVATCVLLILPGSLAAQTPNEFLKRGMPTFIVGTAGDDRADRAVNAQVILIRDLLFPRAKIIEDTTIDVEGAAAWPSNPVVYGGPHVNQLLAELAGVLPFTLARGKLVIGKELFEGDEYRLIAVLPERPADKQSPGYPEFLLYAGTGMPGIAEINGVRHGSSPILIADAFGPLLTGDWERTPTGNTTARFAQARAQRIAWRSVERKAKSSNPKNTITVNVRFPQDLPAASDEAQVVGACVRGLEQAARKINANGRTTLTVYVYPDADRIASLTGQPGDGHAVVEAHVLHVVRYDPKPGGAFERLLTHEGTHLLAAETWGTAGTPLLGEGLAVWASEAYGGTSLEDWRRRLSPPMPSIADLSGKTFREMPESKSYPLAGLFIETAIKKVGVEKVRQYLYGATEATWESACQAAGTTAHELEVAFQAVTGSP